MRVCVCVCVCACFEFVPIVSEVFGRWGPATSHFLRNLLPPAQLINKAVYSKVLDSWWRRLSCSVQKGNAFMLLSRSITAVDANTAPAKRRQREPRWANFLLREYA